MFESFFNYFQKLFVLNLLSLIFKWTPAKVGR